MWMHFQVPDIVRGARSSIFYCDIADVAFGDSFVGPLCEVIVAKVVANAFAAAGALAIHMR